MSEAFIVRRCGGGGSGGGSANPRGGAVLHVLSSSIYTQSVSVEAEGYSMTLTNEQAYPVRDFPNISPDSAKYMDMYDFPIPASWLSKPPSAPRSDYDVTITVHDETASNSVVVNLYPYDANSSSSNSSGDSAGNIRTDRCQEHIYIVAPFPILLDPTFGLNMACEITNNNANLLQKKYSDIGSQILSGPSGSVDADITCFEDGGFDLTIPGSTYTSMYVAGSATGTAKVGLYDTLDNLQAKIDLGNDTHTSVSIPTGTSGLRLNVTGSNVVISAIQFS